MKLNEFFTRLGNNEINEKDIINFCDTDGKNCEMQIKDFLTCGYDVFDIEDIYLKNDFLKLERFVYVYYDEEQLRKNKFSIMAHIVSSLSWEDSIKEFSIPQSCILYKREKLPS